MEVQQSHSHQGLKTISGNCQTRRDGLVKRGGGPNAVLTNWPQLTTALSMCLLFIYSIEMLEERF